jgi:hypothetical protein
MASLKSVTGGMIGAAVLGGLVWTLATTEGPWDRGASRDGRPRQPRPELDIRVGMDRKELPKPDWVARSVGIGIRRDARREGLTINHRVLELKHPLVPERVIPSWATLVYTPSTELEEKVNAVLSGEIPVKAGMQSLFAIGRLVDVRMVHLDADGRVQLFEDVRVSFVGVVREGRPDER